MKRLLLVLLLVACKDQGPCDTEIVELVPGEPFFDIRLGLLERYEELGYECDSESIRDAQGRSIGTKYTCTKC
jgi:hypothetical protein